MAERAHRDQGQGDDAHRLLSVVRAVREGDQRGRGDLADAEALGDRVLAGPGGDLVGEVGGEESGDPGHQRRGHRGDQDLLDNLVEVHPVGARSDPDGADQAAEQGVGGARREAHQPGHEVPEDRSDEPREDHPRRDQGVVDDAAGDRLRDFRGQEGADDVESSTDQNRRTGLQRPRGDGRRHRVGGVVESVGEVEGQGRDDDDRHEERDVVHRSMEAIEGVHSANRRPNRGMARATPPRARPSAPLAHPILHFAHTLPSPYGMARSNLRSFPRDHAIATRTPAPPTGTPSPAGRHRAGRNPGRRRRSSV